MISMLAQLQTTPGGQGAAGAAAGLFMFLFVALIIFAMVFIWGTIFKKAGYSFWLALLMLLPIVNLIWLLVFAFSKWPVLQEVEALRRGSYVGQGFPITPPQTPYPPQAR